MFYQVDNIRPSITVQPSNSVRISNSVPLGAEFEMLTELIGCTLVVGRIYLN